jgi:hypothetical protein
MKLNEYVFLLSFQFFYNRCGLKKVHYATNLISHIENILSYLVWLLFPQYDHRQKVIMMAYCEIIVLYLLYNIFPLFTYGLFIKKKMKPK